MGTRALQIRLGLLVLAVICLAALLLKLSMTTYLLGVVFTYGAFAALIVFQPELRQARARLSRSATGAILAIERDVRLDDSVESGSRLRMRGDQIVGGGCILPLTQNPVSDVLVVSEETATISLARSGNLERGLTTETVCVLLIGVVE